MEHYTTIKQGDFLPFAPQSGLFLKMSPLQQFAFPPGLCAQPIPPQVPQLFLQHIVNFGLSTRPTPSNSSQGSKGPTKMGQDIFER